jgi:hypothetical protein
MLVNFGPDICQLAKKWILMRILRYQVNLRTISVWGSHFLYREWSVKSSTYMGKPFYTITRKDHHEKDEGNEDEGKGGMSRGPTVSFRVERDSLDLYRPSGSVPRYSLRTHRPIKYRDRYQSLGLIPDWLEEEVIKLTSIEIMDKFHSDSDEVIKLTSIEIMDRFHSDNEEVERDLDRIRNRIIIRFDKGIRNKAREIITLFLMRSMADVIFIGNQSNQIHSDQNDVLTDFKVSNGKYMGKPFYNISQSRDYYTFRIEIDSFDIYAPSGRKPILNLLDDNYGFNSIGDILRPHKTGYKDSVNRSHELWQRLSLYHPMLTKGC